MKKQLQDMNLLDDFLFTALISDTEYGEPFARYILETIMGRSLRGIKVHGQKVFYGSSPENHGIRLDAYVTEHGDTIDGSVVYDLEPDQNASRRDSLVFRARYYHVLRDSKLLGSGDSYIKLPRAYVIFVTPYDSLGSGRALTTIQNMCLEDPSLKYDDGAVTLYLYTKGYRTTETKELMQLLRYMENTIPDNACNDHLKNIQNMVDSIKNDREVQRTAMRYQEILQDERDEGRKEGIEEGEWRRLLDLICKKLRKGKTIAEISNELEEDETVISKIVEALSPFAPDYDLNIIIQQVKAG